MQKRITEAMSYSLKMKSGVPLALLLPNIYDVFSSTDPRAHGADREHS
jgi:hypothetical protein